MKESLREQKKLETRERIRRAAAQLFTQRGYGAATMRQIAARAHVGLGTLFNYAEDKRDLVFLIFNEELNAITDVALAAPRPGQALVDQLLAVFRVHYGWLATKPALASRSSTTIAFVALDSAFSRFGWRIVTPDASMCGSVPGPA